MLEPYKSFREAAEALGIPEATLSRLARGENEPGSDTLLKIAKKFNVSLSYLLALSDDPFGHLDGASPDLEFERVPSLDARVAAGAGAVNHLVAVEERLAFPEWMLRKLAPPGAKVSFMRAKGDSMEPLFDDGALLLVDESQNEPSAARPKLGRPSDVFVFLQDDALRVKRLRKRGAELLAMSENRAYDPEIFRGPELKRCKVLGRVIWWDSRL